MNRYGGAEWDSKTGVAWGSERPYKSKGRQRARRVFEKKTVLTYFAIIIC